MTSKRVKWDLRFAYYNLWTVKMVFAHTYLAPGKRNQDKLYMGHWDLNEILPMKMGSASAPPLQVPPFTSPGL